MNESNVVTQPQFDPRIITRPEPVLLKYYALCAAMSGPLFPLTFLPLYFKYRTIEYRFDDAGVSMKWGILFRKEINLTYRRIQDIHLTSNLFQRWMGLATVAIQTASGNSGPEMSIEGISQFEQLRNYLYEKMRGSRVVTQHSDNVLVGHQKSDRALAILHEIRDLLKSSNAGDGP